MIRVDNENRDVTQDIFELKSALCLKKYEHNNTQPVIFAERNIVLLLSPRAGTTFAMKWYLQQNNMESKHAWTHKHRMQEIYPSEWHTERRQDVFSGTEFTLIRFTRNPFSRAVSSFLHSIQTKLHAEIDKWLGHENGYSFLEFLTYVAEVGPHKVNNHFAYQYSYLQNFHDLDHHCQIEGGVAALNDMEAKLELPLTTAELYNSLKSSGHNLDYDLAGGNAAEQVFALGKSDKHPTPDRFYNERTEALVREIYAGDFERWGYSTELPDLSPKQ